MDCVGCFKCRLWGKLQVRFVSSVWELWCWDWPLETNGYSSGLLIPHLCRQQEAADSSLLSLENWDNPREGRGCRAWVRWNPLALFRWWCWGGGRLECCCSRIPFDPCTDPGLGHSPQDPLLREPHWEDSWEWPFLWIPADQTRNCGLI